MRVRTTKETIHRRSIIIQSFRPHIMNAISKVLPLVKYGPLWRTRTTKRGLFEQAIASKPVSVVSSRIEVRAS